MRFSYRLGILAVSPHMPISKSAKRWDRSVGLGAAPEQETHMPDIASQSSTRELAQKRKDLSPGAEADSKIQPDGFRGWRAACQG
jgi:hypothetical protein